MNYFYDLPEEIINKILILSFKNEIIERKSIRRHNVRSEQFTEIYCKGFGERKVNLSIKNNIILNNNVRMYWWFLINGLDQITRMKNSILVMRFKTRKELREMCEENNIEVSGKSSKRLLIKILMGI